MSIKDYALELGVDTKTVISKLKELGFKYNNEEDILDDIVEQKIELEKETEIEEDVIEDEELEQENKEFKKAFSESVPLTARDEEGNVFNIQHRIR